MTTEFDRSWSGRVVDGDWSDQLRPTNELIKVQHARARWELGVPWDETGAFDHILSHYQQTGHALDNCRTQGDVERRYAALDAVYDRVAVEHQLRPRKDLDEPSFRESDGVYVHIGRVGKPIFGGGGTHRLTMALLLDIDVIPAQLGVVHPEGIGALQRLRQPPRQKSRPA